MKKIGFLILILLINAFPQEKYWIYFKDKGVQQGVVITGSPEYKTAVLQLSPRAIERRKKLSGDDFITYEDLPVKQDYIDSLTLMGIKLKTNVRWLNAVSAYLTDQQIQQLKNASYINKIEKVRRFITVKPGIEKTLFKPADYDSNYYGLSFTQLRISEIPSVHAAGITGKGVLLGILDTGFKWKTNEALSGADVLDEYDFISGDNNTANEGADAVSQHNHGTSVFSVIAAKKDSILVGAAYNAQFVLAKTEDVRSETMMEEDNYADAMEWMESLGADITTSSLGYSEFDNETYLYSQMDGQTTVVTKAAEWAFSKGILVITAAGNEGNTTWHYITAPADGFNVIAVGAVDNKNNVAGFSSYGPSSDGRVKPDVTAMGVSVFVSTAIGEYGASSGTSLATPIAAGTAALLLSANPYLTNVQMRDIIIRTAENYTDPDYRRGYGLISAKRMAEYPNIKIEPGSVFTINKIFLDVPVTNAKIFISGDGKKFTEMPLTTDSMHYSLKLDQFFGNQVLKFYYEYIGSKGNVIRVPQSGMYTYIYGEALIKQINTPPGDYTLGNNFPNPFNNSTRINFMINNPGFTELNVYNVLGQKVKTLLTGYVNAGEYSLEWNGKTDDGQVCASGIYIYRINAPGIEESKKMILMK